MKDSEKAILDQSDLTTSKLQCYDIDGNVISKLLFHHFIRQRRVLKKVEENARRSYQILTRSSSLSSPREAQPQQTATIVNAEEMLAEKKIKQEEQE